MAKWPSPQQSRVPKFGNWDGDKVPYTVYFENARRERTTGGGFIMNPNDPLQNPYTFNKSSLEKRSQQRRIRASNASFAPESDTHRTISDYSSSSVQKGVRSDNKIMSMPRGGSVVASFSSPTHVRNRSHSSVDYTNHIETSIPKFGAWDETDPKSAEGFTVIFNKVKKEKQIASGQYPTISLHSASYPPNIQNQYEGSSFRLSKYCCGLFSCEGK